MSARPYRSLRNYSPFSLSFSLFLDKREEHASADTLINGLRHAIPRDPFEKLRTIDLARFRNEGCTLTASLSPYTERGNDANAASVCPLAERKRGGNERVGRETAGSESEIDGGMGR